MATENAILIYGNMETPEEAEQRRKDFEQGIVRYHKTTYLEWEIPEELDSELSEMIRKRVNKFYKVCKCEHCKEGRKNKE